jgi:hypothetical protein
MAGDVLPAEQAWALLTDPAEDDARFGGVNWWVFGNEDAANAVVAATGDWEEAARTVGDVERELGYALRVGPEHVRAVQVLRKPDGDWTCRTSRYREVHGTRCSILPVQEDAPGAVKVVVLDVTTFDGEGV